MIYETADLVEIAGYLIGAWGIGWAIGAMIAFFRRVMENV